jgi:hypothetical protein
MAKALDHASQTGILENRKRALQIEAQLGTVQTYETNRLREAYAAAEECNRQLLGHLAEIDTAQQDALARGAGTLFEEPTKGGDDEDDSAGNAQAFFGEGEEEGDDEGEEEGDDEGDEGEDVEVWRHSKGNDFLVWMVAGEPSGALGPISGEELTFATVWGPAALGADRAPSPKSLDIIRRERDAFDVFFRAGDPIPDYIVGGVFTGAGHTPVGGRIVEAWSAEDRVAACQFMATVGRRRLLRMEGEATVAASIVLPPLPEILTDVLDAEYAAEWLDAAPA